MVSPSAFAVFTLITSSNFALHDQPVTLVSVVVVVLEHLSPGGYTRGRLTAETAQERRRRRPREDGLR
jgi:hypothetical protein